MTRGLFLRADTDSQTVMAVWRRVMGVLCGRYPAWQLDSFTCIDEETDPEGAYTSREFMRWLDGEHYILFARAFGYADETVRETICDYEDYRRAACRCAVLCWDAGYFRSTARTKMCLRRCTATRNCGRCAKNLRISPTKTTGGRRFVFEAIFPAPVLTGRALSAIIKHTVRQSHSCGAPRLRFSRLHTRGCPRRSRKCRR